MYMPGPTKWVLTLDNSWMNSTEFRFTTPIRFPTKLELFKVLDDYFASEDPINWKMDHDSSYTYLSLESAVYKYLITLDVA